MGAEPTKCGWRSRRAFPRRDNLRQHRLPCLGGATTHGSARCPRLTRRGDERRHPSQSQKRKRGLPPDGTLAIHRRRATPPQTNAPPRRHSRFTFAGQQRVPPLPPPCPIISISPWMPQNRRSAGWTDAASINPKNGTTPAASFGGEARKWGNRSWITLPERGAAFAAKVAAKACGRRRGALFCAAKNPSHHD